MVHYTMTRWSKNYAKNGKAAQRNGIDLPTKSLRTGRNELAEAAVIEKYLPQQMSDAELEAAVTTIIAQVGATSAHRTWAK